MIVEVLREETSLSPFLQKLSRTAPFLFMGVLLFGALAWRPTTAPIELEMLASAWHMHLQDTFVPLRNGIASSDLPPLLQWLILAGWRAFGVHEWWARLIPVLASLVTVVLIGRTALVLWPHRAATPIFARLLLTGLGAFAVAMTMVEPQVLALPFILAGFHALSSLWMNRAGFFAAIAGWLLCAIAAAAAVMAGGWSWALIPALCAVGIWVLDDTTRRERSFIAWFLGAFAASALALVPAFLWLRELKLGDPLMLLPYFGNGWSDPATEALRGAPWALLLLPVALYPWICWKTLWRALDRHLREKVGVGFRLCLAFLVAAAVTGLISGWQLIGMLPIVCPLSLLGARLLATQDIKPRDFHAVVPGFFALFVGLIFFLMNIVPTAHLDAVWRQIFGSPLPIWMGGIGLISGLSLLVIGYILAQLSPSHQVSRTLQVAILPTLLMTSLNLEFNGNLRPFFDLTPVASQMKQLQDAGLAVAVFSNYRGEFDFAGRLVTAPEPLTTRAQAARWAATHKFGAIVTYFDGSPLRLPALPMFRGVARDRWVAIWPASEIDGPDSPVLNSQF
jgi:4-amino-4-deoxy-L-arabinose transferase-like glycosyltransferase